MPKIKTAKRPAQLPPMPINPDWITKGKPMALGTLSNQSDDKKLSSGYWECSPGEFRWEFGWDEFAHVFEGEATIREEGGASYTIGPGDTVHFPLGLKTHRSVTKTIKKVFFLRTPQPLEL